MRWTLYAVLALVILFRLPFLPQAILGDDPYYLIAAQHALIDPLHPSGATFVFQGDAVSMQGHPHPPLNAWILAGLIAAFGDIYEVRFHAIYILFSILAVVAMYDLARRFTGRPGLATLLFALTPAFLINGGSLETDVPFTALWLAGTAAFFRSRDKAWPWLPLAVLSMGAAALMSYQAVILIPTLGCWLWWNDRHWRTGWLMSLTPAATIAAFQIFERLTSGTLPAAVLAGYLNTYDLQRIPAKLANAGALTAHLGFMSLAAWLWLPWRGRVPIAGGFVAAAAGILIDANPLFWLPFGAGVGILIGAVRELRDPERRWPAAWLLLFFVAALALFFAGSARYLLPVAAPLAILVANGLCVRRRYLAGVMGLQFLLVAALAISNYKHWQGYQRFAQAVAPKLENQRVWINGEWGLRFYLDSMGGLPVKRGQSIPPGDIVVSSELALPVDVSYGGGLPVTIAESVIQSRVPLRLICLGCRSGYSTAQAGLRPFDVSLAPFDRVRAQRILKQDPVLSWVPMSHPEAGRHLIAGFFALEGSYRWMSREALVALKPPGEPRELQVELFVPDTAPASRLTLAIDGKPVAEVALRKGAQTVTTGKVSGSLLKMSLDRTFRPAGDQRDLGVVVNGVGYREPGS